VVLAGIPEDRLERFHLLAGNALEQTHPDRHSDLAAHFFKGKDWPRAARYGKLAGDSAARVYANPVAADHYTGALEAARLDSPQDPALQLDLHRAREKVYDLMGNREAQWQDLQTIARFLRETPFDTPADRVDFMLREIVYYEGTSDFPRALEIAQETVQLARACGETEAAYRAAIQWGRMARQMGKFAEAQDRFREACEFASAIGDRDCQADGLAEVAGTFFERGEYDSALDHCQRALGVCAGTDNKIVMAKIYSRMGSIYHYLADFPAAVAYGQRALEIWRELGYQKRIASSLYNLATASSDTGDRQTARRNLEQVCEIASAIGDRLLEGYGWVFLGVVLEHLEEYRAATEAYQRGLALRRQVGLHAMANDPLAGLARVKTAQGEHAEAASYAHQVLDWIAGNGHEGIGDPLLAYVGVYRALLAAGERQNGLLALQEAYALLMKFAASISGPERRRAYLHDISPGSLIWDDYHACFAPDSFRRIQVRLARADAPTGKPLRGEELVEVTWTVEAPGDGEITGKADRRRVCLLRLLEEAESQGAAPTLADLAQALGVSDRTVKRDLADLRQAGRAPRTRGSR